MINKTFGSKNRFKSVLLCFTICFNVLTHTHRYVELDGEHDVNFKMLHNNSTVVSTCHFATLTDLPYLIIKSSQYPE